MKDDTLYLIHIVECINRIETYVEGFDYEKFLESALIQDAVLRNLQVLAESTQHLSSKFKDAHSEVEWYKISGLRNILVHDYLGIDIDTVWNIVVRKLPDFKLLIERHVPQAMLNKDR
ncbi:MAG: DUF86 domain-containing protein [Thermodesulfobacteriota bacterium]|nr:DUF86 domain-containing protein [Thermodesulfobacteriota bacterium]